MGAVVIITEYPVSLPRREVWRVQDLFRFLRVCEQGCLYSFFSVSIRAHPWLAYLPPRAQSPSTLSRYIPDTYPTHTRHIRISHEYPTNAPRIFHEYPSKKTAMREATLSTPDSPLTSLLSVCARRWFAVLLSSVLLLPVVWQMFRLPNFHFHSPVFENVCALKNALFCSFFLRV